MFNMAIAKCLSSNEHAELYSYRFSCYSSQTEWMLLCGCACLCIILRESSGYLACGVKSTHVSKDDTQNGQQYQGQVVVDQPSLSDDFWGTSTDYLPGLSQRSISSLSTSNLSFYSDIGSASTNSRGEFVNHGLRLWKQTRLQWLGAKTRVQSNQAQGATISQNATYDSLLNSRQHFRRPIPLGEMVDFLIDTWEQEGLYD